MKRIDYALSLIFVLIMVIGGFLTPIFIWIISLALGCTFNKIDDLVPKELSTIRTVIFSIVVSELIVNWSNPLFVDRYFTSLLLSTTISFVLFFIPMIVLGIKYLSNSHPEDY